MLSEGKEKLAKYEITLNSKRPKKEIYMKWGNKGIKTWNEIINKNAILSEIR